jgi:hypothetical protein
MLDLENEKDIELVQKVSLKWLEYIIIYEKFQIEEHKDIAFLAA